MRFFATCGILFIAYLVYVNADACVQCNSANDIKCATNPDSFLAKECNDSTSKCYTRVLNGNTIRGCAMDLDNATASNCNNEMECLICTFTEGCNRQVFPTHRLQCLQCSGNNENSTCATDIYAKPVICPTYKLGDKCYIRKDGLNKTNSVQRGCLSSVQANGLCKDISNCYTCEGDGCNFLEFNNTEIPLARDSAMAYAGTSMFLLLVGVVTSRFF
ncbi:hypothetical protein FF38_08596 [Lucilia cuprina]|uniref:DUF753 domain-containing protein n=1 Tax=Lucilia cuprina TaxID=7375 RepID=A0A0L0C2I1_LUCCU|nr:hypothetical protein CVS40_2414 [Lucilia cuprina]KNC26461.1 hypothetical protein FF38_08596 [Lucilia cuprina]